MLNKLFDLSIVEVVYLIRSTTDLRKKIASVAATIQEQFRQDSFR